MKFRYSPLLLALTQLALCNPAHALGKAVNNIANTVDAIVGAPMYIVCGKGNNYCSSPPPFFTSASVLQKNYTFESGTDYQNASSWNGDMSVNKVFGTTDCSYLGSTDKGNSVMFGWRDLQKPNAGLIELTGFIDRKASDLFPDGRYYQFAHMLVLPRYQGVNLGIQTVGDASSGYYLFSAGPDTNLIMSRRCAGSSPHFNGRSVSTWFGGSQPAPQTMTMREDKVSFPQVSVTFPKKLKIADQEGICEAGLDPLVYFQNHASGIYSQYQRACGSERTLSVQVLGCDRSVEVTNGQAPFTFTDGIEAFRYLVNCN